MVYPAFKPHIVIDFKLSDLNGQTGKIIHIKPKPEQIEAGYSLAQIYFFNISNRVSYLIEEYDVRGVSDGN